MQIREARPEDIPQIVSVLKASLGEADLPFSAEIWNYKHVINPFGESIVFIAEENGKIAGVRAFMRWIWQRGEEIFSALRAVDTATHPDFQGRGIFKKLTMHAVQMGIEANDHFVFNTPNEKSRPGYLKMGWEPVGKLKVGLQPAWNSFYKFNQKFFSYNISSNALGLEIDDLCTKWNLKLKEREKSFTPKSYQFLEWRYEKNPLQQYEVYSTPEIFLAGYVKKRKNVKELRISECIFNDKLNLQHIDDKIKEWSWKFGVQVISYSPGLFPLQKLSFRGNYGPVLTIRNLNLIAKELDAKKDIENWDYSLGDLELF